MRFRRFFLFVGVSVLFFLFASAVFAESDNLSGCSGKIMMMTNMANENVGFISFDSHPGGIDANKVADLSIVGLGFGLAPADRNLAVCLIETTPSSTLLDSKQYRLEGYAWNDNLGFVSYYCNGGFNAGVACGPSNYGVTVGPVLVDGKRVLSGYAWNDVFGYIKFAESWTINLPGGGVQVVEGTKLDKNGNVTGFAWSEALVWMNMGGVRIQLPGQKIDIIAPGWCDVLPKPGACIEITPDVDLADGKIADGIDGYSMNLYLRGSDGVTPIDVNTVNLKLTFNWTDTVKINQLQGSKVVDASTQVSVLDEVSEPWEAGNGGVVYKPLTVDGSNFASTFSTVSVGDYELVKKISSYAPTSNMNVSSTTGTKPLFLVSNEMFFTNVFNSAGKPFSVEPNKLILGSIVYEITPKAGGETKSGTVYPNGKTNFSFEFKPAIKNSILSDDDQDTISSYRNIPIGFTFGVKKQSNFSISSPKMNLILDYEKNATSNACKKEGKTVNGFDFHFVDGEYTGGSPIVSKWSVNSSTDSTANFVPTAQALEYMVEKVTGDTHLQAIPTLPTNSTEGLCDSMSGPTVYTEISYLVGGKTVSYYGDKLPRITSSAANPAATVHGSIYAPKAFSPTISHKTQATGNISIDIVRNSINENIRTRLPTDKTLATGATCKILKLNTLSDFSVGCDSSYFASFSVGDENVLYFKDSTVKFELMSLSNKWVVIADGGNIYVDKDIYNVDTSGKKLAIVGLRPYEKTCVNSSNLYINSAVRNIQANIAIDCSVFSYDPVSGPVDALTGLPKWAGFGAMINSLSKQLLIEGSITSRNTIGGADLDSQGADYLLLGTGEVIPTPVTADQRLKAQLYDLNYLRLFKLTIEADENGLPIDQICDKALTVQEMVDIKNGVEVKGPNGKNCNGINSALKFNPLSSALAALSGDLVPPKDTSILSQGLDLTKEFDPIYVYYKVSDSFVFQKEGAVTGK